MGRNQRIKEVLRAKGVSQQKVADALNVTQATINQRLNADADIDSIDLVKTVADLTGVPFAELMFGATFKDEEMNGLVQESNVKYSATKVAETIDVFLSGKSIRPVTVVVTPSGKELISLVGVRAQAGYMKGYGDPTYIEKFPAFPLPIVKDGAHRMFEVDGDSMLQLGGGGLHDGDIVIARYVEDILSIKDNRVYVVVSDEGVCVKRVINRLKDQTNPMLVCNSDNKNGQHPALIIRPQEIKEVWELKAFISKQLSFSVDLWETLNDLTVAHAKMEEKIKALELKQLNG